MATLGKETVLKVHHWNDKLFSFRTTRDKGLRFENGQFVMVGLEINHRPLLRAYSIASANHEDHLEFFSIKVRDGTLTSKLEHLRPGDEIIVSRKPTGTLVLSGLKPGRRLYLFATGTGLAPFMSLIHDPQLYERFEKIILLHGTRKVSDLAYRDYIDNTLPQNEYLGEAVRAQLIYFPTVTREPFRQQGRLTTLVESGRLANALSLPPLAALEDRAMVCGSPAMLKDVSALLDRRGFVASPAIGEPGDYVIERAFVEQ